MSLIGRYILREVFGAWLLVLAVLFVIFMSNQLAEILGDAAADRLPRDVVFAVFGLTSLNYLTLLAPLAVFLGVIIALARLARDSELAALWACGVGPGRFLVPIGGLSLAIAGAVAWLAFAQTPAAMQRIEEIRFEAREAVRLDVLEPGRFTTPDSGNTVVYARAVNGDELHDVFVQTANGDSVVVIVAERGERITLPATGETQLVLRGGRRYEGVPGERSFVVIEFDEARIPVHSQPEEAATQRIAALPTADLLASPDPLERAELQWRASAPLSLLVLALLAVALGNRSAPRDGRYGKIGLALLLYVTYVNVLSVARVWLERQITPDWLGLWWVHVAAALLAFWFLGRAAGWFVAARAAPVAA